MDTLKTRYANKINKLKNKELCRCAFCGSIYIEDDIKGNWSDWFRFNVEGNFWELLTFTIKWIVFFFSFFYIGARAILTVIQEPDVIKFICK